MFLPDQGLTSEGEAKCLERVLPVRGTSHGLAALLGPLEVHGAVFLRDQVPRGHALAKRGRSRTQRNAVHRSLRQVDCGADPLGHPLRGLSIGLRQNKPEFIGLRSGRRRRPTARFP